MLLFQLISERYQSAATVLTSNEGFEDWGQVPGAEADARLRVRHAHQVDSVVDGRFVMEPARRTP